MPARKPWHPFFTAAALLCGAVPFMTGCDSKPSDASQSPPSPPQKVRVELRPPSSGERLRRHIYGADGTTEVELQIEFADGSVTDQYLRADGTVRESTTTYPGSGLIRQHVLFDADGTTVLSEERYRQSGTLVLDRKRLADGTQQTNRYAADGKRLVSVELLHADQTAEKTYFWDDGVTRRARLQSAGGQTTEIEVYASDGTLDHRRAFRDSGDGLDIYVYRADGTVNFHQSWKSQFQNWWVRRYSLEFAEELQADGKTVYRKLVVGDDGRLSESHLFNPDGTKKAVRYFRNDGTLERVEIFDRSGKVVKVQHHSASEAIRETVDQSRLTEPAFVDPSGARRDD